MVQWAKYVLSFCLGVLVTIISTLATISLSEKPSTKLPDDSPKTEVVSPLSPAPPTTSIEYESPSPQNYIEDYNSIGCPKNEYVNSYWRSDGTYVSGYWRNSPSDYCY